MWFTTNERKWAWEVRQAFGLYRTHMRFANAWDKPWWAVWARLDGSDVKRDFHRSVSLDYHKLGNALSACQRQEGPDCSPIVRQIDAFDEAVARCMRTGAYYVVPKAVVPVSD
jgi:hypothetical protein